MRVERRFIIQRLDSTPGSTWLECPWSGIYPGDFIEGGIAAVTKGRRILLGVAAILRPDQPEGGRSLVFSIKPSTRDAMGVALTLVHQLVGMLQRGVDYRQRNWILSGSPEQEAMEVMGFQVSERCFNFEIQLAEVSRRLEGIGLALDCRRPLQTNQRVTPWQDSWRSQCYHVAQELNLASVPSLEAIMTPGSSFALDPETTSLAFEGSRLVGMFLCVRQKNVFEIPVRWVAPGYRGTWVNARLLLRSLADCLRRHPDVNLIRFRGVENNHQETQWLCQRFNGVQTASSVRMHHV